LVGRWRLLAPLEGLVVVLVHDPQGPDEAEGGAQPAQGRLLVRGRPRSWDRPATAAVLVAAGPEVQIDLTALELELVDLAFAVVLAPGLERE